MSKQAKPTQRRRNYSGKRDGKTNGVDVDRFYRRRTGTLKPVVGGSLAILEQQLAKL